MLLLNFILSTYLLIFDILNNIGFPNNYGNILRERFLSIISK